MVSIAIRRLFSQQIAGSTSQTPGEVVARMGAMQGQDYAGAKWSVGLRLPGSTDAAVEQAFAEKAIVRTWALRGTLQLVAAADICWLLALVAPRVIAGNARRYRQLALDEETLRRSNALLLEALQGGRQQDRSELMAILRQQGISTEGQRAPYLLQRAALDGLICQGTTQRNNPCYMALEESLPETRPLAREAALAELAGRYFATRGPATLQDFAWWSGLLVTDARAGLEAVQSWLARETIEGQEYWLAPDVVVSELRPPSAYLLPGFDEYLISYRDRSASLDPAYSFLIDLGNGLRPTVVTDGRVAGTWRRTIAKGAVKVELNPFAPLAAAESQALEDKARRYAAFLGIPAKTA